MKDNELDKQSIFGFYGSLRLNEGNWNYFLRNAPGVTFLQTVTIFGYDLFSLGSYPVILKSKNPEQPLVIDLFRIENERVKNGIDGMELGAGYSREHISSPDILNGEDVLIYIGEPQYFASLREDRRVPDGDWSKRKQITHKPVNVE